MTTPAREVNAAAVLNTIAAELDGTHGLYTNDDTVTHYAETDTVFEHGPADDTVSALLRVIDGEGDVVAVYRVTVEAVTS